MKKSYTIYASMREDAHQNWVWLKKENMPARTIVKITNPANNKSIYCEALQIDRNFLNEYHQRDTYKISDQDSTLIMNGWFRASLGGIDSQSNIPLIIEPKNNWYSKFAACIDHPQAAVRVATWLGLVGVVLGMIGLILGFLSIR